VKNIVSLSTLALTLLAAAVVTGGTSFQKTAKTPTAVAAMPSMCPPPLQVCAFDPGDVAQ
jgi:hypothetical protein